MKYIQTLHYSQPVIHSSDAAVQYCQSLLNLLMYSGVSDGDITNAGGETDINVVFDIVVE